MRKALFIIESKFIGGAEIVLDDYIKQTHYCHSIHIMKSEELDQGTWFKAIPNTQIINIRNFTKLPRILSYFIKPFYVLLTSFKIITYINKNKISVVVSNNSQEILYLPLIKLYNKKIKTIAYFHDLIHKRKINGFFLKNMAKYSIDNFIAVSNAVKERLMENKVPKEKIIVLFNGVQTSESLKKICINPTHLDFIFVGRLDSIKNPLEYLDFLILCKKHNIEYRAKIIFIPQDEELLSQLIEKISQNKLNIKLLQNIKREQVIEEIKNSDFLVLTSIKDSLPTVILESFSVGTPVIAHNVGGVRDMVVDGSNGFIYNDKNRMVEVVKKIKSIDDKTYQYLSENAIKTIKNKFDISFKVKKLDQLLFMR